jgi:Tfp pilus assembly protein PilW
MSRINAPSARRAGGYTLGELMVAMSLAFVVIAGVISAYLFVGRNLTRLANVQQQDVKSRRALKWFTQDLSAASQLTTATSAQLVLTMPTASGSTTVTYTYTAGAGSTGTLTRTVGGTTTTLLTNLSTFSFNYYNSSGTAITPDTNSVKGVDFTYLSRVGTSALGTRATTSMASPRVVLRNKSTLQ